MFCISPACAENRIELRGNELYYGEKLLQLQGVAMGDPVLARSGRTMEDYSRIAREWNANVVRISIHPGTWRDIGRVQAMETLKRHVYAAIDSGLFVIVTWHAIGAPNDYYQGAKDDLVTDAYDSDFALAQDFWKHMAWHFGKERRVMFELWNEPVSGPEGAHQKEWGDYKPYWEKLISLLRTNGAENVLIASSGTWGYDLRGVRESLLSDKQVAYAWHIYAGSDNDSPERWDAALDRLSTEKPVIVTEWGFEPEAAGPYRGTAQSFGVPFREKFLRGLRLHYTAWCWHPQWTPRLLEQDWKTPTAFGQFVHDTLMDRPATSLVRP